MPLTRIYHPLPSLQIAFWTVTEKPVDLLAASGETAVDYEKIKDFHPNRQAEILAVRCLLRRLLGTDYQGIEYDDRGKPNLVNSTLFMSISHSKNQVAVALNSKEEIGIDLEYFSDRIIRLQQKFMSAAELAFCVALEEKEALTKKTLIWSAKESLYKWYGKKELDFRKHLLISDFSLSKQGKFKGQIKKESLHSDLNVGYLVFEDFVLTYACF